MSGCIVARMSLYKAYTSLSETLYLDNAHYVGLYEVIPIDIVVRRLYDMHGAIRTAHDHPRRFIIFISHILKSIFGLT